MVVEKPANYDQPQTVNDELLIPAQVGQEVQLEPGTDEPINVEMTEDGGAVVNPEQEQIETGFDGNLAEFHGRRCTNKYFKRTTSIIRRR